MDLSSAFVSDWQVWDNTEAVSLSVARAAGPYADAVPVAKRRALTTRELAASGGVYTGQDRVWLLPVALLTPGLQLKPADAVVDASGTRWTVLEAALNKFGATWRLTCRDLVLAFDLRVIITIERAALSYDAAGAAVKTFPPAGGLVLIDQLPARVQPLREEVADQRGLRGPLLRYDVIVGRPVDGVSTEDRVKLPDGSYLDILGYRNPDRIDELPVLECQRKP